MKTVVYGQDSRVCKWVADRIGDGELGFDCHGIGLEQDGELIAGVGYNIYTVAAICMHVAAVPGKRWMTRDFLWRAFAYPFLQLKCNRVTALVRVDNEESKRFVLHLGFKYEGLLRQAANDGQDMIVFGMLRDECRWLGVKR